MNAQPRQSQGAAASGQGALAPQQQQQQQQQHQHQHHSHAHRRLNLGGYTTEDEVLDVIEQSRRVTRLIISAVQKGSNFEVSQILEHYGLLMTSRLHFKVVAIVMEQWFSLMGIEDEEQIWNILRKNIYAMEKIRNIAPKGTMVLSDLLTEWELPIGALQSKIIRRIQDHIEEENKLGHKIPFSNKGQKQQQQQQANNKNNANNKDIDEKLQEENQNQNQNQNQNLNNNNDDNNNNANNNDNANDSANNNNNNNNNANNNNNNNNNNDDDIKDKKEDEKKNIN